MHQRAVAYNYTPGLLTLEHGVRVMNERLLMGVLKEVIDPRTDPKRTQSCLRAIRNDAFLRMYCVYCVLKTRNFIDWSSATKTLLRSLPSTQSARFATAHYQVSANG